ncbi:MAG: AraC family transcriptional regulator [Lachnospiraceae bacterium]|nr:AraC family transcriptional regulator [Lachnospiraceae bacterium]MCI9133537.1 AraC family transcriptional regulator [Lachnospiraceae bacterium]
MKYEIVTLEEKIAVGVEARTSNLSPEAGSVIGGLWKRFYEEGVYASIPKKENAKALGIYTEYARGGVSQGEGQAFDGKAETAEYTVVVACETKTDETGVGTDDKPQTGEAGKEFRKRGYAVCRIPAGRYARFVIHGDMVQAVAAAWQEIWQMDLPRAFQCDFEEYQNDSMDQAEIHIYVGLKEKAYGVKD